MAEFKIKWQVLIPISRHASRHIIRTYTENKAAIRSAYFSGAKWINWFVWQINYWWNVNNMWSRMTTFAGVDRKWNEVKTSEYESYETSNGHNVRVSAGMTCMCRDNTLNCAANSVQGQYVTSNGIRTNTEWVLHYTDHGYWAQQTDYSN
jgi:hypothetical protein